MEICGFEKFSMVDFDKKIACTVFTNGCNLRCPFCHNSSLVYGRSQADTIPESDVFDYLIKRRKLVDAVCVSGGEPTLQHDLTDFIKKVKDLGLLVKLDTNGTNPSKLKELLDQNLLDYVAMDIKNSEDRYNEISGRTVDISKIKESVAILKNCKIEYEFRTTLISNFHTENDIVAILKLISGAPKYYFQKYVDNDDCIEHGFTAVPKETAEQFATLARQKVGFVGLR
ncbi:MAG: anaerobic ribonucleoside-triphosphate reductase activating protein, partial [Clostridia bacterium]